MLRTAISPHTCLQLAHATAMQHRVLPATAVHCAVCRVQLPLSFPQLAHVSICHALGMNISSNDSSSEGQAAEFQQQLPQVLQQVTQAAY